MGATSAAIRQAIRERRRLRFNYRNYSRLVEPYALGCGAAGALCAWQVSGGDEAQVNTGWKIYALPEIRGIAVAEERFAARRRPPWELRERLGKVAARIRPAPAAAPYRGAERRGAPRASD